MSRTSMVDAVAVTFVHTCPLNLECVVAIDLELAQQWRIIYYRYTLTNLQYNIHSWIFKQLHYPNSTNSFVVLALACSLCGTRLRLHFPCRDSNWIPLVISIFSRIFLTDIARVIVCSFLLRHGQLKHIEDCFSCLSINQKAVLFSTIYIRSYTEAWFCRER